MSRKPFKKAIYVTKSQDGKKEASKETEELRSTIRKFEEASGVRIDQWKTENIGRAVKIVLALGSGVDMWTDSIIRKCDEVKRLAIEIQETELTATD
jgi:hypothetical protein